MSVRSRPLPPEPSSEQELHSLLNNIQQSCISLEACHSASQTKAKQAMYAVEQISQRTLLHVTSLRNELSATNARVDDVSARVTTQQQGQAYQHHQVTQDLARLDRKIAAESADLRTDLRLLVQGMHEHSALEIQRLDSMVERSVSAIMERQIESSFQQKEVAEVLAGLVTDTRTLQRQQQAHMARQAQAEQRLAMARQSMRQQSALHNASIEELTHRLRTTELAAAHQHQLSVSSVEQLVQQAVDAAVDFRWQELAEYLIDLVEARLRVLRNASSCGSGSEEPMVRQHSACIHGLTLPCCRLLHATHARCKVAFILKYDMYDVWQAACIISHFYLFQDGASCELTHFQSCLLDKREAVFKALRDSQRLCAHGWEWPEQHNGQPLVLREAFRRGRVLGRGSFGEVRDCMVGTCGRLAIKM